MPDLKAKIIDPFAVQGSSETGPFPFDFFEAKCLAQGDSWFSIGSIPPGLTTNVLEELWLSKSTVVVNCARPGKLLSHMTRRVSEPMFLRLLTGTLSLKWDAILISGGGNDLIDAITVGPDAKPEHRLLLTPEERPASPANGDDYISEAGWETFERHLKQVFGYLVDRRDSGQNRDTPMFFHNYAPIMPRPAPAGGGHGPWFQPALDKFSVPREEGLGVSTTLMNRLTVLIGEVIHDRTVADPQANLHMVNTDAAGLVLGVPTDTGESGDWQNEIHPARSGYKKLARSWRQALDPVL